MELSLKSNIRLFFFRFLPPARREITCFGFLVRRFRLAAVSYFSSLSHTHTHTPQNENVDESMALHFTSRLCVDISVAHFIAIFWHRNNVPSSGRCDERVTTSTRCQKQQESNVIEVHMYCIVRCTERTSDGTYPVRSTEAPAHHQQSGMRLFILYIFALSYFHSHLYGVLATENKRSSKERREWKKIEKNNNMKHAMITKCDWWCDVFSTRLHSMHVVFVFVCKYDL